MPRAAIVFITAAVLLTIVGGVLLICEVPTVQRLPGWFWSIRDKDILALGLLVAVAFALPLIVWLYIGDNARTSTRSVTGSLAAMIILGFALQYGLAFAEMRGLGGMRNRIVWSGHAEFARTASRDLDYWHVLTRYEELVQSPDQAFARSKPPGQLLFYMGLSSVADAVMPSQPQTLDPIRGVLGNRHRRLVDFAAIVLPLLSNLALIPITLLARRMLPRKLVLWPALFFLLAPPTALVTLHLDQALYPLLAMTMWLLAARAGGATRRSWAWGVAAGIVAWLGLFVSFSLLPALPLAAVFAWVAADEGSLRQKARRLLPALLGFVLAFLCLALLAWLVADYDMIFRFRSAMAHHQAWMIAHFPDWQGWPESPRLLLSAAVLNLAEFGYWLGLPMLGLFLWAVAAGARSLLRRNDNGIALVSVATALLLLITAWFGGSIGETARLWIFMIPAVALVAADRVARLAGHHGRTVLLVLAATQFAWMFLLKAQQDFW